MTREQETRDRGWSTELDSVVVSLCCGWTCEPICMETGEKLWRREKSGGNRSGGGCEQDGGTQARARVFKGTAEDSDDSTTFHTGHSVVNP